MDRFTPNRQHKEWISSLLIAASTEAAVDSPKLYEPVMSRCLVCPPRANQALILFLIHLEHK
jgi:hypothetical protein